MFLIFKFDITVFILEITVLILKLESSFEITVVSQLGSFWYTGLAEQTELISRLQSYTTVKECTIFGFLRLRGVYWVKSITSSKIPTFEFQQLLTLARFPTGKSVLRTCRVSLVDSALEYFQKICHYSCFLLS